MSRRRLRSGRARYVAFVGVVAALAVPVAACGSYDTGSGDDTLAEHACLDLIEAFARSEERCGADYATAHDQLVQRDANGDCKNIRAIRDENALRKTCIPFVQAQACTDLANGKIDPSCSAQLLPR